MFRQINIQDLEPGMVIVRVTEQNGPVKIKKAGLVTSQYMVQGLIEMGIQQLEVDPDQTVEVAALAVKKSGQKIKKSATLRMLESNNVTNTRIDDGLSEQFNRSLFLPSVQGIPSPWQFYSKRYLLAVFIALGGLGLGWTLANYQEVLALVISQTNDPVVSAVAVPVPVIAAPVTQPRANNIQPLIKVDNLKDVNSDVIVNVSPSPQKVAVAEEIKPSLEKSSGSNELEQIMTSPIEPAPFISAELLKSFQKAMVETEDLTAIEKPIESVSGSEDVPRVDQLPPWVMNRLPSMAFSAHMYASVDSERWVRVNGTRMVEGDKIDGIIEIVRIEPQHVILNYSGETFSMAALTDW